MKCFYHTDMDGKCAGAIVYKFYKRDRDFDSTNIESPCEFHSINYNNDFPFEIINPNETVIIVDFSLQKEGEFEKLKEITDKIIWIDHHKTAIEKHKDFDCKGIRKDGISGCELTWEYFYPNLDTPQVVKLLGDYDIWAFKYGDDTNYLQTGIRLYDTNPESNMWIQWLSGNTSLNPVLGDGEISLRYRNNYYRGLVEAWSFNVYFEGYRCIACNAGSVSSQLFDSVPEDSYDIMMPFVFDGKQWTVSLYTKRNNIDCSEIAKKHGGGGHKQASGFQCKELPFKP